MLQGLFKVGADCGKKKLDERKTSDGLQT